MHDDFIRIERYVINQKYIEWSLDCNDKKIEKAEAFKRVFESERNGVSAFFCVSKSDYQIIFNEP